MSVYHYRSETILAGLQRPDCPERCTLSTVESEGSSLSDLLARCTVEYVCAAGDGIMFLSSLPRSMQDMVEHEMRRLHSTAAGRIEMGA